MKCYLCSHEWSPKLYPDIEDNECCPNCNTQYFWEEGLVPLLTDEEYQLILVRRQKNGKKRNT